MFCFHRFAINLQCGPNTNPRDDLALHINARLMERVLVRNSLIMGQWGQEDRHSPSFPFLPGQGFEIVILADSHHYKVSDCIAPVTLALSTLSIFTYITHYIF